MRKIYMIFTGGTISMKIDDVSHTVKPALSAKEIMQSLLNSELYHELEVIDFSEIPSPSMTPEIMLEISYLIKRLIENEDPAVPVERKLAYSLFIISLETNVQSYSWQATKAWRNGGFNDDLLKIQERATVYLEGSLVFD